MMNPPLPDSDVLIIGLTENKSKIPENYLKTGLIELHLELGVPDQGDRYQILLVLTDLICKRNLELNQIELSYDLTENLTGLEIACLIRQALNNAFFSSPRAQSPLHLRIDS